MKNEEAIINDAELYWQDKDIHNILSSEESKLQNNLYVCNILFLSKHTVGNKYILMCICTEKLEWLFLNRAFLGRRGRFFFFIIIYAFFPKISSEVIYYFTGHTASLASLAYVISFPDDSDSKESICNAGDLGSIPGLGRSPGAGNGYPLGDSCLENPRVRGAWRATVHRVTESDTTELLSTHKRQLYMQIYFCLSQIVSEALSNRSKTQE